MKKIFAVILALCILFMVACAPVPETLQPPPRVTLEATPEPSPESRENAQTEGLSPAEILQFQSDARYVFEQLFLPGLVYEEFSSEAIIEALHNFDTAGMEEFFFQAWDFFVQTFLEFSLIQGTLPRPIAREDLGLGEEHIVEVTMERLDENASAIIIKLLDIEEFLRSTYIAIVYGGAEELQMFTLEQSHGFHMFCFVNADSRGSFFAVENNREAFIEAILSVLET